MYECIYRWFKAYEWFLRVHTIYKSGNRCIFTVSNLTFCRTVTITTLTPDWWIFIFFLTARSMAFYPKFCSPPLTVNVSKTKGTTIDFRNFRQSYLLWSSTTRLLRSWIIINILAPWLMTNWGLGLMSQAHQHTYFLQKFCDFNVDLTFMKMFYTCFIESVPTFSFICSFLSLSHCIYCFALNIRLLALQEFTPLGIIRISSTWPWCNGKNNNSYTAVTLVETSATRFFWLGFDISTGCPSNSIFPKTVP